MSEYQYYEFRALDGLGFSRSEYVRTRLAQDAAVSGSPVTVADLAGFASAFSDLADPDVMSRVAATEWLADKSALVH